MKKRIIAWAVLLSVCAAALGLWCSAAAGKTARTLPCKEEGLILSITTFDGKSESKPFLKCFGHTWIGLDNRTGHTVYLKDRAIPDGEMVTFSVWAVSGLSGLLFDLEPCYIANYGRYTGRLSLSTNIGEEQLKVIEDYMEQHDKWTVDKNCSYWSIHLWNAVVGEDAALKIRGFVCTPASACFWECWAHGLPERPRHSGRRDGHLLGLGGVGALGAAVRSGTVLYRQLRPLHRQTVPEHQYRGRAAEGHRGLHGTAR